MIIDIKLYPADVMIDKPADVSYVQITLNIQGSIFPLSSSPRLVKMELGLY